MGQHCLSSHVPTAFQALVRDQMPQPSSVGTEVDGGGCKNISQGATLIQPSPCERGCHSHTEGAAAVTATDITQPFQHCIF